MKKRIALVSVLLTAACGWAAENQLTLKSISESRTLNLVEKESFFHSGVELTFRVSGDDIPKARKWGNVKVNKAVDDVGTDLTKVPKNMSMTMPLQEVMWGFGNDKKKDQFDLQVRLPQLSARGAKALALVEGTVDVVSGGEKTVVEIADLPSHYGKPLEDPTLKSVGITFTLVDPTKKKGMTMGSGSVSAEITGDSSAIQVEIVDAAGKSLGNGSMWNDEKGVRNIAYMLNGKLPADAKVKITAFPGQKVLTLPFKLENQALP